MSELPDGWIEATLGDVVRLRGEKATPTTVPHLPFLGLEDVEAHTSRIIKYVPVSDVRSAGARFSAGEILYSRLRPYLNKVVTAEVEGLASAEFLVLQPEIDIRGEFIRRRIMAEDFLAFAALLDRGDRPRVNFEQIAEFPILLPPAPEQRRIVAKLDALLAGVSRARKEIDRIPILIAHHKQALLAAAFSGELTREWREENSSEVRPTNRQAQRRTVRRGVPETAHPQDFLDDWNKPPRWRFEHVGAFLLDGSIVDVKDGNHGSNHPKRGDFRPNGLPFITAAQLTDDVFNYLDAPKIDGEPLNKLKVGFAEPGDVLLSHKGTVGRTAICTQPCVLSPQTTYYRLNAENLNGAFLRYLFMSPFFQKQLRGVESQTTRDFVPILRQYQLFLLAPPLAEQELIARILDEGFRWLNAAFAEHARAEKLLPKLEQAILTKAFRGELVAQDPADESASVLLKRIRAERAAAGTDLKQRKPRGPKPPRVPDEKTA